MLDYYLYVYFPSAEVFSSRTVFLGYGLLPYLVLWLCFSYLRQRSTRAALERELAYQREVERSAADAERANAAKTGFLRRMSHDLRTPIHGIRGMVELSRRFPGDEAKQEECRAKIMDASGFLLELARRGLGIALLRPRRAARFPRRRRGKRSRVPQRALPLRPQRSAPSRAHRLAAACAAGLAEHHGQRREI